MARSLREHPRIFAARTLAVALVFLAGFGLKAATTGDPAGSKVDRSELTAAQSRTRGSERELSATRGELGRTRARLGRAARRDRAQRRTESVLRRRARGLRRALTRARR